MSVYLITYDLNRPGQQYEALYEAIKSFGAWWHYLDSTWLVQTSLSAQSVWNRLEPAFDKNDRILISALSTDRQGWLPEDAWKWIRDHE